MFPVEKVYSMGLTAEFSGMITMVVHASKESKESIRKLSKGPTMSFHAWNIPGTL